VPCRPEQPCSTIPGDLAALPVLHRVTSRSSLHKADFVKVLVPLIEEDLVDLMSEARDLFPLTEGAETSPTAERPGKTKTGGTLLEKQNKAARRVVWRALLNRIEERLAAGDDALLGFQGLDVEAVDTKFRQCCRDAKPALKAAEAWADLSDTERQAAKRTKGGPAPLDTHSEVINMLMGTFGMPGFLGPRDLTGVVPEIAVAFATAGSLAAAGEPVHRAELAGVGYSSSSSPADATTLASSQRGALGCTRAEALSEPRPGEVAAGLSEPVLASGGSVPASRRAAKRRSPGTDYRPRDDVDQANQFSPLRRLHRIKPSSESHDVEFRRLASNASYAMFSLQQLEQSHSTFGHAGLSGRLMKMVWVLQSRGASHLLEGIASIIAGVLAPHQAGLGAPTQEAMESLYGHLEGLLAFLAPSNT